MKSRNSRVFLGVVLLGMLSARPALAQAVTTGDLKKEIDSLRETLLSIQKDLQEIKGMLARQGGPRSVVGVVVDLATNPFKGDQTAPLTLVEFSDYQ